MGAAWTDSMSVTGHLGELVGYKAGLALTRKEIAEHLVDAPDIRDLVLVEENRLVRVRSEEFEAAVHGLLYRVGNIPTPRPLPPGLAAYRRFENSGSHRKVLLEVLNRCNELLGVQIGKTLPGTSLDPAPLLEAIWAEYGRPGVEIAITWLDAFILRQHVSPWASNRWFDWEDTAELRDLFDSESLETQYGSFIDQRFLDYLARDFSRIDKMNWRKFEGLTGEFFERAGFRVEMGPGRGDGGIDIRLWAPADDVTQPPLALVQCKRQQERISQVVVKALWADVKNEDAQSGLIVTTSSLSPSAETVRTARGYPIVAAERPMLRNWIEQLRSPGSGTFLA